MQTTTAEARLRARNQLTLPDSVVTAASVGVGDRFIVEISAEDPDTIRLHRIRSTYAGSLRDVYGDVDAYLDEERRSWE